MGALAFQTQELLLWLPKTASTAQITYFTLDPTPHLHG